MQYRLVALLFMAGFVNSHHSCLTWELKGENLLLTCRIQQHVQSVLFKDSRGKLQATCTFNTTSVCESFHIDGNITANTFRYEVVFIIKNYGKKGHIHEEWTCYQDDLSMKTVVSTTTGIISDTDLIMSGTVSSSLQSVNLLCFSCREPYGNNVEFLKDGISADSIRYNSRSTKCTHINGECRHETCSCTPSGNEFTRRFVIIHRQISTSVPVFVNFSCRMKFVDTKKSSRFSKITTVVLKKKEVNFNRSITIITKAAVDGQDLHDGQTNVSDDRHINNRTVYSIHNTLQAGEVIKWAGIGVAFAMPLVLTIIVVLCYKPIRFFRDKNCRDDVKSLLDRYTEMSESIYPTQLTYEHMPLVKNRNKPACFELKRSKSFEDVVFKSKADTKKSQTQHRRSLSLSSLKTECQWRRSQDPSNLVQQEFIDIAAEFTDKNLTFKSYIAFRTKTEMADDGNKNLANADVKRRANFLIEETKKAKSFLLDAAKQEIKAPQLRTTEFMLKDVTCIKADGHNKFADDNIKLKPNCVLNATKQNQKAYLSRKSEEIFNSHTDITVDDIDKLADYDVKGTANLALHATTKEIKTYKSGKTEVMFNAVNDITADGIDKFADDDVKHKAHFALNATRQGVKAFRSGKTGDMFNAVTNITADRIDKLADDDVQPKAHFALNATRQGVKALRSGKTEDMFNAVTDITADGIDKFADDDVKHKANFALNATRQGVKAFRSGKTGDMFNAVTNITADRIDKFADDDVKHTAHFALNASKLRVKAFKSGKTEDISNAATTIALDGIDKFADDDMKHTANFVLNASKPGVKSFKSDKTKDMFNALTDITADGIDKFVDDGVKHNAHFALNATRQGIKALKSGETGVMFNAVTDITADGIEKFVDDDVKHTAHFALNASKPRVKSLKSGKTEDILNAVKNITTDGIEKFADVDVKHTAHFVLNATRQGVEVSKFGKTEDKFNFVTNITTDEIDVKHTANFATKQGVKAFKSGKTEDIFNAVTNITADGIDKFTDDGVTKLNLL